MLIPIFARPAAEALDAKKQSGLTVMEQLALKKATEARIDTKVLDAVQLVLENELIPVVQSKVNGEMRDMQLNNQLFSLPASSTGAGNVLQGTTEIAICPAAKSCAHTAAPLFTYWLQLPQHSDMVSTILDRLIRGFVSSAREELEAVSWKLLSFDERSKIPVLRAMRADPIFKAYRLHTYNGKASVEDIVGGRDTSVKVPTGSPSSGAAVPEPSSTHPPLKLEGLDERQITMFQRYAALELFDWGRLWKLSSPTYPITADKITRDFAVIGTITAILHGADWLVNRISRICQTTTTKLVNNNKNQQRAQLQRQRSKSTKTSSSKGSSGGKSSSSDALRQQHEPLWVSIGGGLKELSKLAEDGFSLLRGEVQLACFYHLHHLAHMKSHGTSAVTNGSKGSGMGSTASSLRGG